MKRFFQFAILLLVAGCGLLSAQEKRQPMTEEQARQMIDNLKWQTGDIPIGGDRATLKLAPGYRFLDSVDTNKVMNDLWGNLPSSRIGMIFPDNTSPLNTKWAVIIQGFDEEGYVKDEDADKDLNPDKLLKDLQEGQKEANEELARQGLPQLEIVGWAAKPKYDKEAKKLTWAIDLKAIGSDRHGVNYYVRVLGRHGFVVIKMLGGLDQMTDIEASMPKVLSMINFNEGHRYADFNPKTDKVAAYGIAGLIAAGVGLKLLKVGFFAALFKPILAFALAAKKLVVVAVLGIGAFIKKLFGRKDSQPT